MPHGRFPGPCRSFGSLWDAGCRSISRGEGPAIPVFGLEARLSFGPGAKAMTRLRSFILLSIPLLALVSVGFLIADQQTGNSGWLIGAYVSLGLLVVAGLLLSERPELFGAIHAQAPEPSSDDLLRVINDIPAAALPTILRSPQIAPIEESPGDLDPFALVEPPAPEVVVAPVPVVPTAEQQAAFDSRVADIFVNLGRRNKHLNRQMLTLISHLEHDQLDPEILQGLYELDHLATRMRRNEETLLMLANPRKVRQWTQPVKAENVLRSALAEVERFVRVELDDVPDVEILGSVVSDVTHLLAELIDNATEYSHSSTLVTVSAHTTLEGIEIEILDSGHGIDEDKLIALNEQLADPPELADAPVRRLGLFIAARFALDHDITIELTGQRGVGTVATIALPHTVLVEDEEETADLDALDLVDPVHVAVIGSELGEAEEIELADATFPTLEEVAEAFPTVATAFHDEPPLEEELDMVNFPSVEGVLDPSADVVPFDAVMTDTSIGGVSPLPSRIPQATFESVWGNDAPNTMPAPGVSPFGAPDVDHTDELAFDEDRVQDVARHAGSSMSAFATGVARGLSDVADEATPQFSREGEDA